MHISQLEKIQRREFLRRAAALGIAGSTGPLALSLSAMGEASAQTANDYKALVCIFLYGGNDHDNTFIPYDDANHLIYKKFRDVGDDNQVRIYWNKDTQQLVPLSTISAQGSKYAFQPAMTQLAGLFETSQLGVMLNVGTLLKPTTKQNYISAKTGDLPPKLFSHNDQFSLWQSAVTDGAEGSIKGWGGRLGDIFLRNGGENSDAHFTCINASGNAVFMSGSSVLPYQVSKNGPVTINSIGNNLSVYQRASCKTALNQILTSSSSPTTHWMEQEWMRVLKSSLDNQTKVTNGISTVSMSTTFQTDTLSAQLNIIAKLIAAGAANSSSIGVKRQVFFASLGGFDLHDNLMANHSKLLKNVNDAMNSFYLATKELSLENQVTTFTASDFGRTLSSNGDGSDHGWGSHHMVMGGAVDGKKFWGKAPVLADNYTDTVGQGRLLPSTSVDEFAASMARWMGVSDSDLNTVLPNYAKFSSQTLPLFKPIIT
ncbi:MAG: DUF1501 domain-containing protein [Actinobacteria bacterium]|uniref:Unannotated protein n=1 Tax=freshwater metagenome TaxID=449393 RepID=A0A6J6XZY5_9ZZZZ|nr:DUF1501 domain-containing protein [Actinomycetota bacterium]